MVQFLQFTHEDSQRVMITSEDSKVRILDGVDIVHKYKGTRVIVCYSGNFQSET